ncbi:MAG TPA: alpha/beta hydrolase-fold protein [Candidatus Baltobacteraceae bacterium]|nr:alpha/beta hydrolase-fold protein [Candidatus Baltobacteraceae bacterium]
MLHLVAALAIVASPTTAGIGIDAMRQRIVSHTAAMRAQGADPVDYLMRLNYLDERRQAANGRAPAAMLADLEAQTRLELQLDDSLLTGTWPQLAAIRGGAIALYSAVASGADPYGIYVPSPDARGRYALVVMLHGAGETEADVISRAIFRHLAAEHHAIVVAPWAHGDNLWHGRDASETMAIVNEVARAFPIDARRTYIVGISMGGAGAFHLATVYPNRFSAVMTIVGDLRADDAPAARQELRDRDVYMVSGGKDPIMTPAVEDLAYGTLEQNCVPVSRYVAPDAGHDLYQTAPQVEQAWNDMFAGTVRDSSTRECSGAPGGIAP